MTLRSFEFGPTEDHARYRLEEVRLYRSGVRVDGVRDENSKKELLGVTALRVLYGFLCAAADKPDVPRSHEGILRDFNFAFGTTKESEEDFAKHYSSKLNRAFVGAPFGEREAPIQNERSSGYKFNWFVRELDEIVVKPRGILRHLLVSGQLIPRKAALEKLKRVLLRERAAGTCTYLTAAAGMGGIGKTVLASLAMNDPDVQWQFPDGIIAITIGRSPGRDRLIHEIGAIPEALTGSRPDAKWTLTVPEDSHDKLCVLLRDKKVLLVIDDLWDVEDISWLPRDLGSSAVLVTTRQRGIANSIAGVAAVDADFLTPDEARALLAFHAGTTVEELPGEADSILAHCGQRHDHSSVPAFAVCMAGAMAKGSESWRDVLSLFGKSQIQAIGPGTPIEYQKHRTIYDWIHASVDFLQPDDRDRYLLCSGFRDDQQVEEKFFRKLWRDRGGNLYRHWLGMLAAACLLNRNDGIVTFHDLHLDYLRYRAKKN